MGFITPTKEQFRQFRDAGLQGPLVMVNLLKFKPDGGAEAFEEYAAFTLDYIRRIGGRLIYRGEYRMALIGEGDWDEVLIVEYPSVEAFLAMQRDDDYLAVLPKRLQSLSDCRVFATTPGQ